MRLEHAQHNEQACDFLLASGKFNDWVVTSAFYSSLHYMQSKIFPFEEHDVIYDSLEQYMRLKSTGDSIRPSKHKTMILLVNNKYPLCGKFYKSLYDRCMRARYVDYRVTDESANISRLYLTNIKAQLENS